MRCLILSILLIIPCINSHSQNTVTLPPNTPAYLVLNNKTTGMGFARSARVMSQLEAAGIVGPQDGKSKNREVLVDSFDELDGILKTFQK